MSIQSEICRSPLSRHFWLIKGDRKFIVDSTIDSTGAELSPTGLELQFFESPGEDKQGWTFGEHSVKIIDLKLWRSLVALIHVDPDWHLGTFLRTFTILYYWSILVGDRFGLLWFAVPVLHATRELFQPGCKMQGSQIPISDCAVRGPLSSMCFSTRQWRAQQLGEQLHLTFINASQRQVMCILVFTLYIADIANK